MILNKLRKWLYNNEKELPNDRHFHIARFLSLLVGIQGIFMFCLSLATKSYNSAIVSIIYGIAMILVYLHTTFSKKLGFFYSGVFLIALFLELNFLIHGGTQGFGIIWILIIPLFSIYLLKGHYFHVVNTIYCLILIIGMWTPLYVKIYPYEEFFRIRFPLVYLLEFLFGIFIKYRITKTETDLELQRNTLTQEINQAALIQTSFFKQHVTQFMDWTVSFSNIPMAGVSGDFYDIYSSGGILNGVGIFDVSGHGISSGLITMLVKNTINQEFTTDTNLPLNKTVEIINRRFLSDKGDIENYFTGIIVRIDGSKIEFVNAGHQYPILYRKSTDSFEQLKKASESFGAIGLKNIEPVYVSQYTEMESGDELILFTDGLIDTKNAINEKFGHQRFMESLETHISETTDIQIKSILEDLKAFQDQIPAVDDVTIMILKKD